MLEYYNTQIQLRRYDLEYYNTQLYKSHKNQLVTGACHAVRWAIRAGRSAQDAMA